MLWEQPATITRSLLPTGPTAANLPQRHAVARRDRHTQTDKRPYYVDSANKHLLYLTHTHTHNHLTALFPGLPGSTGTRKVIPIWILLKQETVSGSGISWAICKSAPRSRHITMPAPHHSVFFTGRMPFLPPNQQRQSTEGNLPYLTATKLLTSVYHNASVEA